MATCKPSHLVTLLFVSVAALLAIVSSTEAQITPAKDAPQPLTPAASAAKMQLPPGFRIELVASEPIVQDPSCVAFDERGRLFVTELHGYNVEGHLDVLELNKAGVLDTQVRRLRWEFIGGKVAEEARKHQYGVVKLLTDRDGDGIMDNADVWADDLPPCYGIAPVRGGILVACAPDIVYLADRDDDGKPEIRETLYTGFNIVTLERGINNPRWGVDNWIYVGAGGNGGTIRGPKLTAPFEVGRSDFRIKPDGSAIETVNGAVGTYGLALSDFGDRFPCSGGRPARYALPLPHHYLKRNPYVPTPETVHQAANYSNGFRASKPHPWRVRRGQDPAWVKFYGKRETNSNYFTGGCGGEIYRAELFPEQYRGHFFYCEPSLNIVHRSVLERDGSGYKARRAPGEERSEFLASTDQWFRPINLRVGPDGALYIVDMYREIIEDYSAIPRFLQQQYGINKGYDRGRVWRLVPERPKKKLADLSKSSTHELVSSLADANAWWRHTAQRLIVEQGGRSAVPELSTMARSGSTPQGRMHALYTLDGLGELQPSHVIHALDDPSHGVRMHALRLAGRWMNTEDALVTATGAMTEDPDPRVRLQLAMTLGQSKDPRAARALLRLARQYGDERWMSAAILSSVKDFAGTMLVALLEKPTPIASTTALLAPLAATISGRRAGPEISRVLSKVSHTAEKIQRECLHGLVTGLSRGTEPAPSSPDDWAPLKSLLGSDSSEIRTLSIKLAAALKIKGSPELESAFAAATKHALDVDRPLDERQRAVELLANAPFGHVSPVATALLDARQPPELQQAAIKALGSSDDTRVGEALLKGWQGLTPNVRNAVLKTIISRRNRVTALLDAIEAKIVRRGDLNDVQREQLAKSDDKNVADRAKALLENPTAGVELQKQIDRYQKALSNKRNPQRGKEVFDKTCLACHTLNDKGHEVGPELGSVISKPDEAILLDILDPSGHIESEYGNYIVVTKTGQTFVGILAADSPTSVTLRKEKGTSETILRQDIAAIQASDVSLMPSNLHEQITPRDAADLIAFLRKAFAGPAKRP